MFAVTLRSWQSLIGTRMLLKTAMSDESTLVDVGMTRFGCTRDLDRPIAVTDTVARRIARVNTLVRRSTVSYGSSQCVCHIWLLVDVQKEIVRLALAW